jgi:hypothetical protein
MKRIYLKEPNDFSRIGVDTYLVHEAAHNRHFNLHDTLTEQWMRVVGITSSVDLNDPHNLQKLGFIHGYAAKGYTCKRQFHGNAPPIEEGVCYQAAGRDIVLFDDCEVNRTLQGMQRSIKSLPAKLGEDLPVIGVYCELNRPGLFIYSKLGPDYDKTSEDVAKMTGSLTEAFYAVNWHAHTIEMLQTNPKTRARAELLIEHGFLEQRMIDILLKVV